MTTFPSAGAVILRESPAGVRSGFLKNDMKKIANPTGMSVSIHHSTLGAPRQKDNPPRIRASASDIMMTGPPSLCIFISSDLYSPNSEMYRTVTGKASSAPSKRSSSPPCPGMMRPASLTPKLRFNWDSAKSPTVELMLISTARARQ